MPQTTVYTSQSYPGIHDEAKADKLGDAFRRFVTWFFDSIQVVVIAMAVFVVVYLWVLSPHQVKGHSMDPTFRDRELLIADKITVKLNKLKRGDIIIFKFNNSQDHIKRIIGLPGDTVMIKDGKVYINGSVLKEDYLPLYTVTYGNDFMKEGVAYTVPPGNFIVMGDNRAVSLDSRTYGFLNPNEHEIKGRAWIVFWPFDHFRVVGREE